MKELEKEFIGRGEVRQFKFNQLMSKTNDTLVDGQFKAQGMYLYQVTTPLGKVHFEVFYRKYNKMFDCISYPSAKAFGIWAKTTNSYATALDYFNNGFIGEED